MILPPAAGETPGLGGIITRHGHAKPLAPTGDNNE
jgi:hypothetical protein